MYKKGVVINADGRGYYEYLPALFIYDDIHFGYLDTLKTDFYDLEQMKSFYQNSLSEKRINKYFVGTALLQSPFFATAHLYTKSFQKTDKADGFSKPYQRAILFGAIFYLFVGLIFTRKLLETYDIDSWFIFFAQLSILYATSLFTYTIYDPAYSHVYSFALISGFIWIVRKFFISEKSSYILWTFVFLGLITIVRPVNMLVILFIPFLANSLSDLLQKLKSLFLNYWRFILLGIVVFVAILSIQFYISYLQTGNPLNYNYGEEGFFFMSPRFVDFLFSYHKGFFLWCPWWFLVFLLGTIFWLKSKQYYHLFSFYFAFILVTYVFSSWSSWSYGGSFGSRPMVDFYGAFILLIIPIYQAGKKIVLGLLVIVSLPLAVVNLIQSVQYQKAIIHWDGMSKDKYWEVFLNTNEKYSWYFWREQLPVGKKQHELVLFENLNLQPSDSYDISDIDMNEMDSLSDMGQFVIVLNREAENEYMEVRMLDSLNKEVWYDLQRFFNRNEGNKVVYSFDLPAEKEQFKKMTITIRNVREPLKIKKATFSTHYSLY